MITFMEDETVDMVGRDAAREMRWKTARPRRGRYKANELIKNVSSIQDSKTLRLKIPY